MKKSLFAFAASAAVLSLTACGNASDDVKEASASVESAVNEQVSAAADAASSAAKSTFARFVPERHDCV